MADGNSSFAFKMIIFAVVIMLGLPLMINCFIPTAAIDVDENDVLDDYYRFTGQQKPTKEAVWVLTGIYTPVGVGADGSPTGSYGITDDHWVYGSRVTYNRPTQYQSTSYDFDILRDEKTGVYRYASDSADYSANQQTVTDKDGNTVTTNDGQGHKKGDLYTSVTLDIAQKSDIFFAQSMRHGQNGEYKDGDPFWYDYTGYRYSFQPLSSQMAEDADGNRVNIPATTSSLSVIWYSYYRSDGIASQLTISGNDGGVAYLTSDAVIKAFNSVTSVAKFDLVFNGGVKMGIYIQINPMYLAEGKTVEYCYNMGYWSIMVTSMSSDMAAYNGPDFHLDIWELFDTITDLMTFDYSDYRMSPMMGTICSFVIIIPLYAGLISLAIGSWPAMALVGIAALIEGAVSAIKNLGWGIL